MVGKQGDETMKMLDTLSPQSESRQMVAGLHLSSFYSV